MADLHGSHYDVGYLYVQLLANETAAVRGDIAHRNCVSDGIAATVTRRRCRAWAVQTYAAFMHSEVGNSTLIQEVLELFLDWQYLQFLVHGLPTDFADEMQGTSLPRGAVRDASPSRVPVVPAGIVDAAYAAHMPYVSDYVKRTMVCRACA